MVAKDEEEVKQEADRDGALPPLAAVGMSMHHLCTESRSTGPQESDDDVEIVRLFCKTGKPRRIPEPCPSFPPPSTYV